MSISLKLINHIETNFFTTRGVEVEMYTDFFPMFLIECITSKEDLSFLLENPDALRHHSTIFFKKKFDLVRARANNWLTDNERCAPFQSSSWENLSERDEYDVYIFTNNQWKIMLRDSEDDFQDVVLIPLLDYLKISKIVFVASSHCHRLPLDFNGFLEVIKNHQDSSRSQALSLPPTPESLHDALSVWINMEEETRKCFFDFYFGVDLLSGEKQVISFLDSLSAHHVISSSIDHVHKPSLNKKM